MFVSLDTLVVASTLVLVGFFGWSLRVGLVRAAIPLLFFVVGFSYSYFLDETNLVTSLSAWWIAGLLAVLFLGYLSKYIYDIRAEPVLAKKGLVKAARLLLWDFRVMAIFIGLLVSIILSFPIYEWSVNEAEVAAKAAENKVSAPGLAGFWLSFYSSWVASVAFFAVVGLVAGLTALYRPEADVFAARVKILLGGKTGPAVDYVAEKLGEVGYVARLTDRKISIEEFCPEKQSFRLRIVHKTSIRNLYHDVKTDAVGEIGFNFDKLPVELDKHGELVSFWINDSNQLTAPATISADGLVKPWSLSIPGDEEGVVAYEHWAWYLAEKEHTFSLGRFTERLDVQFENRCSSGAGKIKIIFTSGTPTKDVTLDYDEEFRLLPIVDKYPKTVAYSFKLERVGEEDKSEALEPSAG